jgi:hypothetical protein
MSYIALVFKRTSEEAGPDQPADLGGGRRAGHPRRRCSAFWLLAFGFWLLAFGKIIELSYFRLTDTAGLVVQKALAFDINFNA